MPSYVCLKNFQKFFSDTTEIVGLLLLATLGGYWSHEKKWDYELKNVISFWFLHFKNLLFASMRFSLRLVRRYTFRKKNSVNNNGTVGNKIQ